MDDATKGRHLGLEGLTRHELEQRPNDAFVGDDENGLGFTRAQMTESPLDSTSKIPACLAFRKFKVRLLGLPIGEEGRIGDCDLFTGHALPTTEMNLTKIRFDSDGMTWRDDLRGFPGTGKGTCPDRFEGFTRDTTASFASLGAAKIGKGYIGRAVVTNARLAQSFSVANEDQARQSIRH